VHAAGLAAAAAAAKLAVVSAIASLWPVQNRLSFGVSFMCSVAPGISESWGEQPCRTCSVMLREMQFVVAIWISFIRCYRMPTAHCLSADTAARCSCMSCSGRAKRPNGPSRLFSSKHKLPMSMGSPTPAPTPPASAHLACKRNSCDETPAVGSVCTAVCSPPSASTYWERREVS
jgi:hypothetical protein